jgi:hypothetical protein
VSKEVSAELDERSGVLVTGPLVEQFLDLAHEDVRVAELPLRKIAANGELTLNNCSVGETGHQTSFAQG